MAESGFSLPSGSGGLMRYHEEYDSKLKIKPSIVVLLIIIVIVLVTALKIFLPVA